MPDLLKGVANITWGFYNNRQEEKKGKKKDGRFA